LGWYVRQLVTAHEHGDHEKVRVWALRLLVDLPHDYSAARDLLRRLRDLGEWVLLGPPRWWLLSASLDE